AQHPGGERSERLWRCAPHGFRWQLRGVPLVHAAQWRRLGVCRRRGCARPFGISARPRRHLRSSDLWRGRAAGGPRCRKLQRRREHHADVLMLRCRAMRFAWKQLVRAGAMCALAWVWLGSGRPALAQPAPTTGVLNVSARVESGCRVVGQSQVSGVDFGELDFAAHPSLFKEPLTAQTYLSTDTLQLRCVGVTSAYLTVDAGMHAVGSQRRLAGAEAVLGPRSGSSCRETCVALGA